MSKLDSSEHTNVQQRGQAPLPDLFSVHWLIASRIRGRKNRTSQEEGLAPAVHSCAFCFTRTV